MIVDDQTIDRSVISSILTKAGYHFSEAVDGESVIRFFEKSTHPFDLILLDRVMTGMSGIDVLQKLSMIPEARHIPVVMVTSHAERFDQKNAYIYGVFDVIFKPVDKVILLNVIKRALKLID